MEAAPRLRQQATARKMSAGRMGLAEGRHPYLLDAIELGRAAWDKVPQKTVVRYIYLFYCVDVLVVGTDVYFSLALVLGLSSAALVKKAVSHMAKYFFPAAFVPLCSLF